VQRASIPKVFAQILRSWARRSQDTMSQDDARNRASGMTILIQASVAVNINGVCFDR
jgi:hypothetical protein